MSSRSVVCRNIAIGSIFAALFGCNNIDLQATTLTASDLGAGNSNTSVRSSAFYVSGRKLFDPCGDPVVLRGVNEMVTYIPDLNGLPAFTEIAKTHANAVRIYWHTSNSPHDLDQVLNDAESRQLIAIVYVFNNESADTSTVVTTPLSDAIAYWTRTDVVDVIQQHQHWLILALREKNISSHDTSDRWAARYDDAVSQLRHAGIETPLAIDAPSGGSDVATLLAMGQERIAADPLHNLLLNVNSGESGDSGTLLADQLRTAYAAELPLLVGEISGYLHSSNYTCGDAFDFATVLAAAEQTDTGWLAWSWGYAKNEYCSELDMTSDGTYAGLHDWGLQAAVTDPNSLQNTSSLTIYQPGGSCPSQ